MALVARTRHLYDVPGDRLVNVIGDAVPSSVLAVPPLGDRHWARYDVIAEPPLLAGGLNATRALFEDSTVVVAPVGTPGAVVSCGVVKLPVLVDQLPLPTLLVARTSQA